MFYICLIIILILPIFSILKTIKTKQFVFKEINILHNIIKKNDIEKESQQKKITELKEQIYTLQITVAQYHDIEMMEE